MTHFHESVAAGAVASTGADRPRILAVDDDAPFAETIQRILQNAGYDVEVALSTEDALSKVRTFRPNLMIVDLVLPGRDGIELLQESKEISEATEIVVLSGQATIEKAVQALRLGAYDFIEKPVEKSQLMKVVGKALERQLLFTENTRLKDRLSRQEGLRGFIGVSSAVETVRQKIATVAPLDLPVLITGESGTGKEIVAERIHVLSQRSQNRLVKISCAAIPETLLESELFGYERGAFSGAHRGKPGRVELADSGTLFLDEIGDMAHGMQAKLLRVLQDGRVQRLGGTKDIAVEARFISATNINIREAIQERQFRDDLYHRLSVFEIHIPPLRERIEDIPVLVRHFLDKYGSMRRSEPVSVNPSALEVLEKHHWPGNVRELENVVLRAVSTAQGETIEESDVQFANASVGEMPAYSSRADRLELPVGITLAEMEKLIIDDALRRSGGDREKASRLLGISSRTIYRRFKREE